MLHDLESAHPEHPFHKSIARLTREAGSALGEPLQLEWGLQEGRRYVLSASLQPPERSMG